MQLIHQYLEQSSDKFPTKNAVFDGKNAYTYEDLVVQSERFAAALQVLGVKKGDRVGLLLPNSWQFAVATIGILKLGGVFVPLGLALKRDRVHYVLRDAGARYLITDQQRFRSHFSFGDDVKSQDDEHCRSISFILTDGILPEQKYVGLSVWDWSDLLKWAVQFRHSSQVIDVDLAALIYTSGSTGLPKGVMLTHRNMVCAASSIAQYLELNQDDVILNALPMSFDYGLYQLFLSHVVGASLVLEKSFVFPSEVLSHVDKYGVTGFPLVPTMAATMLAMDLSSFDLSSLRFITSTAANWPYEHITRLERSLGYPRIYSMYGLTECKRVSYLPPEDLHRKPGSVGIPIPNTEVMILNDSGEEVTPGEVGQLVVRGSHVMSGYWNATDLTDSRLRPGLLYGEKWLYTGDLFRRDSDGYLYFVGRVDDMIKSRGEKVIPREIEDLLHQFSGVNEALVLGLAHDIFGEEVVACVVPSPGYRVTSQELKCYLASILEDYKVPRRILICSDLPRTANGKIDKLQVKQRFRE